MIERAGCSWMIEDRRTERARREFADSTAFHDAHGDDLTKCDSWLCVCGNSDSRGGSWDTTDARGLVREPTASWEGHVKCTNSGRIYNRDGMVVSSPGAVA